jgi:tetratricopeptide (TPR) repeat protein
LQSGLAVERVQHNTSQASALLSELEPLMRKKLPPGHYAFASLSAQRATVALAEGDLALALKFSNEAVQIGEAGLKKRGAGAFAFPGFLLKRSAIELASGNTEQAIVDANRALSLQKTNAQPGRSHPGLGAAYLALARALHAQGKHDEARIAARSAAEQLSAAVGPDHPDTHSALQIAGSASN